MHVYACMYEVVFPPCKQEVGYDVMVPDNFSNVLARKNV